MNSLQAELTAGREALRFTRKDHSKIPLVVGMYAVSLQAWQASRTFRAAYFVARHLDDVLDGELAITDEPALYAAGVGHQIQTGNYDQSSVIAQLASFALPRIEASAGRHDDPKAEFGTLISAMIFDYGRRQERSVLNQTELATYYDATINPSLNLLMTIFSGAVRASDIPDYAIALGRLYSVRDLPKDWRLGIINVPETILSDADINPHDPYRAVADNAAIRDWITTERFEASRQLRSVQQTLGQFEPSLPITMVNNLINKATCVGND